jgi:hypothetical protein
MMIRILLTGAWVCAITAGASYAVAYWKANAGSSLAQQEYLDGTEYEKTKIINVPIIADGAIQGYVIARFVFTIEAKVLRQLSVPPEAFIVDEAFRKIYAEQQLDFRTVTRHDLAALTKTIKERVNERMQSNIIQDVLIEEFNYISKDELRH